MKLGIITLIDSNCFRSSFFEESVILDAYTQQEGISQTPEISDNNPVAVGYILEGSDLEIVFVDTHLASNVNNKSYRVTVEFGFMEDETETTE
jgi:long-subunit acyl-CoA synthetase (AMP-forming)